MSDLLPLLTATIRDKVLADAKSELDGLNTLIKTATAVEIIRAIDDDEEEKEDLVIYASGNFEDGKYADNPNIWEVTVSSKGNATCKLSELGNCHICVGGGFPVYTFKNTETTIEDWEDKTDNSVFKVAACFSMGTCVTFSIQGWPKEEWEPLLRDISEWDPYCVVDFLTDPVALRYPDATVEFKSISWATKNIQGPLKRLLPRSRRKIVEAQRDEEMLDNFRTYANQKIRGNAEDLHRENIKLSDSELNEIVEFLILIDLYKYPRIKDKDNTKITFVILLLVRNYTQNGRDLMRQSAPDIRLAISNILQEGRGDKQVEEMQDVVIENDAPDADEDA